MAASGMCKRHSGQIGGWSCAWCGETLCAECVARKTSGSAIYDVCCVCGGPAHALERRRSDVPFARRLLDAWRYPLSSSGLVSMFAAGLVLYVLGFGGSRGQWIAQAVLWSYVFSLARRTAMGSSQIEPPDFTHFEDLYRPALHGFVALAVIWLPALVYVTVIRDDGTGTDVAAEVDVQPIDFRAATGQLPADLQQALDHPGPAGAGPAANPRADPDEEVDEVDEERGGELDEERSPEALDPAPSPPAAAAAWQAAPRRELAKPKPFYKDPVVWLLVVLGILYAPIALMLSAAGGGIFEVLNPMRAVAVVRNIPNDYLVALAASFALALAYLAASFVGGLLRLLPVPIVSGLAAATLSTYVPFLIGRVFGLLLYVRGADLGFLPEQDAFEPLARGAVPRGDLKPELVSARPPPANAADDGPPIGLSPANQVAARVQALEPAAAPAPVEPLDIESPPAPATPEQRLVAAVDARDFASALAVYAEALAAPQAALSPNAHLLAGKAAAVQGDLQQALRAFKAAATSAPDDPIAPKALILMARVYGERLNDATSAAKVYAYVLKRYPGTEAAAFAQQRLGPS